VINLIFVSHRLDE